MRPIHDIRKKVIENKVTSFAGYVPSGKNFNNVKHCKLLFFVSLSIRQSEEK